MIKRMIPMNTNKPIKPSMTHRVVELYSSIMLNSFWFQNFSEFGFEHNVVAANFIAGISLRKKRYATYRLRTLSAENRVMKATTEYRNFTSSRIFCQFNERIGVKSGDIPRPSERMNSRAMRANHPIFIGAKRRIAQTMAYRFSQIVILGKFAKCGPFFAVRCTELVVAR